MKYKMVILLMCSILALSLYYYGDLSLFFFVSYGEEIENKVLKDTLTNEEVLSEDMYQKALLSISVLEDLIEDESLESTEELERLSIRRDVIGYVANLTLGERAVESGITSHLFFRRALDLYYTEDIHYQLATSLREIGEEREAITEYLFLVPGKEALEALDQLNAPIMEICRAFVQSNQREKAIEYISDVLKNQRLDPSERMELHTTLGELYAQSGQYREAIGYLKEVYEGGNKGVALWYAQSLQATGDLETASLIYEEMGARGARPLGNILLQQGRLEEAAKVFSTSNSPIALWQSATTWERLSQTHRALEIYQQLVEVEGRYRDDAAYRAYILLERHRLPGAEEMLEILKEYPAWSIRLTGKANWRVEMDPAVEIPSFLFMVEALEERGHHDWAQIELSIGQKDIDSTEMLALSDWYLRSDRYYLSTIWGMQSLVHQKTHHGYLLAYPRPYEEIVLEAASEYHLDPHLIWAVMREESHFRPQVLSVAGAMGLMQIMPTTGQEIAGQLGKRITNFDLLRPEISIHFGAYYLRRMLHMFNEDLDKALAAYNGGPSNVLRWSNSPLGTTPADFPTAITYVETRNYITKVLETYYTYNWLYGDS